MAGTPYLIGSGTAGTGSTTLTVAVSTSSALNDSIVVGVLVSIASVVPAVTDTQGNTYTQLLSDTTEAAAQLYVFESSASAVLTAGTDTVIVTYTATTSVLGAIAVGDNNVGNSDAAVIAHGSSTAPSSGSSGTLSQTEEHAIAFICDTNAGGTLTWAAPWSSNILASITAATTTKLSAAYQDVTATTALTASGTITSAPWTCALITDEVSPPTLSNQAPLADGFLTQAYSQTLEATGGIGSYTYAITSGSLPTGVSLSAGVISGTPTVAGNYTFTITITDSQSVTGTSTQTVSILANGASGLPAQYLPNNRLTLPDSDFESGSVTWAADTNASSVATQTVTSFTGSKSLKWVATADGLTQVSTGFYTVKAGLPYIASCMILPAGVRDTYIGIEWYTSGSVLISTTFGDDNPSSANEWQPLQANVTSPATATKCKIVVQVGEANKGDVNQIDLAYFAQSGAQILIDWVNSPYAAGGSAGNDFMDVTMWTRQDQEISITRGRQDAISEIQPGTATFMLQNDTGIFTRQKTLTPVTVMGGTVTTQRRCQINLADQNGVWYTRFDGPISEIDYDFDDTGLTSDITVSATDVLAFLNRQDQMVCWTKEQILADSPQWHWTLDDAGNSGAFGVAAETSGNNGPPLRLVNYDSTGATATIAWQDTTGGVETLADAISPASTLDGSEYWSAGSDIPNSQIRGLDSGVAGPYTAPIGSPYFTPKLTAKSDYNLYIGNAGYMLQALLPTTIAPTATGSDYSIEIWFTMDPKIGSAVATKYGPYTLFSLGNSRTGLTMVMTIAPAGTPTADHLTFQLWTYINPPAYAITNFNLTAQPTYIGQIADEIAIDTVNLPHHAVVTISGDPVAPTVSAYIDGALFSANNFGTPIPTGGYFDTVCVGGAYGGFGNYYGNLGMFSVYDYVLGGDQILNHCQMGQYGMWEQPTDDCIAAIAGFANIPSFWSNIGAHHNGLTLTEYQDITGSNPLTNMQLYEQSELGLLFVDCNGQLNFHTRDWRMGYGAPDLLLPPDTFDADMSYELIDQFQVNEQAVSTAIFQIGASYINSTSQDEYGTYATNGIGTPLQLPLITWNRAYSQLGLANYFYWPDPYLDDYCAWLANSRSDPFQIPGALTIEMIALDAQQAPGVTISALYALEIDNMIAPSGTLPASFPTGQAPMEWFIEGIQEIYSTQSRMMTIYCSPAAAQRCWLPGDPTYGVLGSTTRIGISAPDTNQPVADGKDVSHDAGGPYWSPQFVNAATLNSVAVFTTGTTTGWSCSGGTLTTDHNGALYPVTPGSDVTSLPFPYALVGTGTGGNAPQIQEDSASFAVTPGEILSVTALTYVPVTATATIGLVWLNSGHSFISSTIGSASIQGGLWVQYIDTDIVAPAGAAFAYPIVGSTTVNSVVAAMEIRVVVGTDPNSFMNNPAQNNHGFIGANDIRGLVSNVSMALEPPMLLVSATTQTQTFASGSDSTPQVFWDYIHIDTQAGMGLSSGWPNWYVVTVPGYYDIDASLVWAGVTGAANATQAFIIVAQAAQQGVANHTSGPTTNGAYVCPIGEQTFLNAHTVGPVDCPTTRLYLGVGDMVTIGAEQSFGSNMSTTSIHSGSHMSLIWRGYSTTDDRVQVSTAITGGSVANPPPPASQQKSVTKTYKCTSTYAYYGSPIGHKIKDVNGSVYQGQYEGGGGVTGSESSLVFLPWKQMQSDLGGNTIKSITLRCRNQHTWYGSGGKLILGWSTRTSAPGSFTKGSGDHPNIMQESFSEGQSKTFNLPVSSFGSALSSSAGALTVGNFSTTNLEYYGFWAGGPSSWTLTVTYVT